MTPRARNALVIALCATLLSVGGAIIAVRMISTGLEPKEATDPGEYGAVLKEWSTSNLVSQFPRTIPPQARNVRLSAFPGFLQGGAHIQLRMRLPADEIREIEARLRQSTKYPYTGSGPETAFYTADPGRSHKFSERYKLYVLQADEHLGTTGESWDHGRFSGDRIKLSPGKQERFWNHGDSSGVAVASDAGEVVYWAESW